MFTNIRYSYCRPLCSLNVNKFKCFNKSFGRKLDDVQTFFDIENICALRTKTFSCPYGTKMWIDSAMYGRLTTKICGYGSWRNMSCHSDVTEIVRSKCQNNMVCKLQVTNNVYGDPCPGTFKYLQIKYRCTTKGNRNSVYWFLSRK